MVNNNYPPRKKTDNYRHPKQRAYQNTRRDMHISTQKIKHNNIQQQRMSSQNKTISSQKKHPIKKRPRYSKRFKMLMAIVILFSVLLFGNIIGKGIQKKNTSNLKSVEKKSTSTSEISTTETVSEKENTTEKSDETTIKMNKTTTKLYYEETTVFVNPQDENWQLILVNKTHKLPDDYNPNLSPIIDGQSVKADSRIKEPFNTMYQAAKQSGIILTPYSAYISKDRQNDAYNNRLNYFASMGLSEEYAKTKTETQILPGGFSEANLGLSVDIINTSTDFASTNEYRWLNENAHNYGFILRYPENKTEITGMSFAPWHWRFVGRDAAKNIKEKGICLEEYLNNN